MILFFYRLYHRINGRMLYWRIVFGEWFMKTFRPREYAFRCTMKEYFENYPPYFLVQIPDLPDVDVFMREAIKRHEEKENSLMIMPKVKHLLFGKGRNADSA